MTPPDDLVKRARQIHRTDSREIIEELAAALESDRAKLARLETFARYVSTYRNEGGTFCHCGSSVKTCLGGDCIGAMARKALGQ